MSTKELDLFLRVMLEEETPAVLSLVKLCDDHGYGYHLTRGQRTTSHPKWQEQHMQYLDFCTIRCPWSVDEFLYFIFTYFFNIFIAGDCDRHEKSNNRKK